MRDVAFFDVDIGRAIFAHRAELDQMAIRQKLTHREQHVQRAHDIVHLGENGVLAVNHRIGSGALFGKVHDRFRLKTLRRGQQEIVVGNIADEHVDGLTGETAPRSQAILSGRIGVSVWAPSS